MENADLDGLLRLGGNEPHRPSASPAVAASHRAADGRAATVPTDVIIAMSFC